jgi:hypothetical protein
MIRQQSRNRRNRRALRPELGPAVVNATSVATIVAGKARLTFSVPVICRATPFRVTSDGNPCTGFTQVSATVIDLSFAAPPVATDVLIVPPGVQEFRTRSGGGVDASTTTF